MLTMGHGCQCYVASYIIASGANILSARSKISKITFACCGVEEQCIYINARGQATGTNTFKKDMQTSIIVNQINR